MYRVRRCDPKLFEKDLSGKVYVITGANSGLGLETARQLVRQGAHVVMGCRRVDAGEEAAASMAEPKGSTEVIRLDLADLSSVRAFAATFLERHDRLDALVNNAGVMAPPFARTKDGFELQFGVNHLGHFLLTELLLDVVKKSAPSRIIVVSSVMHAGSPQKRPEIHFDDLAWETRSYVPYDAYAESKLANVLHGKELARRLEGTGVSVFPLHPGWARSNLIASSMPAWIQNVLLRPLSPLITMMSNEDAAQTSLHCLLDDDVPAMSGRFFSQNSLFYQDKECRPGGWPMRSPNPNAHDEEMARKLYEVSRQLVGLEEQSPASV